MQILRRVCAGLILISTSSAIVLGAGPKKRMHPAGDTEEERRNVVAQTDGLPPVDKVVIYAVTSPGEQKPAEEKTFPVRAYENGAALILASKEFTGRDVQGIADLWRKLDFDWGNQAFCHEPAYGLRFYAKDKLLFETSVCWKCTNFYYQTLSGEYRWYGFHGDSKSGKALLASLRKVVPHPALDKKKKQD